MTAQCSQELDFQFLSQWLGTLDQEMKSPESESSLSDVLNRGTLEEQLSNLQSNQKVDHWLSSNEHHLSSGVLTPSASECEAIDSASECEASDVNGHATMNCVVVLDRLTQTSIRDDHDQQVLSPNGSTILFPDADHHLAGICNKTGGPLPDASIMSEGSDHIFSLVNGSEPEPSVKENSVRSAEDDKGVSGGSTSQTGSKKTSKGVAPHAYDLSLRAYPRDI